MASSPTLGPRLRSLLALIRDLQANDSYDLLWDCCCDHGYLGINILRQQLCPQVNFVDQVASIIELLRPRLSHFSSDQYRLITSDVGQLDFNPAQRHLVIIAGVGGENTVTMLQAIERNHPDIAIDYLFCPSTSQYQLREHLISKNYSLAHEALVTEKGRDYEVIYVRQTQNPAMLNPISLTGLMWDADQPEHLRYLRKLVTHYKNQSRTDDSGQKREIMQHYQRCLSDIGG